MARLDLHPSHHLIEPGQHEVLVGSRVRRENLDRVEPRFEFELARLSGVMTEAAVSIAARAPVEFTAGMVKVISPDGRTFIATLTIHGRKIRLTAPLPGIEPVEFALPPEDLLPCKPEIEVLVGKLSLLCEVNELPDAVKRAMGRA